MWKFTPLFTHMWVIIRYFSNQSISRSTYTPYKLRCCFLITVQHLSSAYFGDVGAEPDKETTEGSTLGELGGRTGGLCRFALVLSRRRWGSLTRHPWDPVREPEMEMCWFMPARKSQPKYSVPKATHAWQVRKWMKLWDSAGEREGEGVISASLSLSHCSFLKVMSKGCFRKITAGLKVNAAEQELRKEEKQEQCVAWFIQQSWDSSFKKENICNQ